MSDPGSGHDANGNQQQQNTSEKGPVPLSMNNFFGNIIASAVNMASTCPDPSNMTSVMSTLCPGVEFSFVDNRNTAGTSSGMNMRNQQSASGFLQQFFSATTTPMANAPVATEATPDISSANSRFQPDMSTQSHSEGLYQNKDVEITDEKGLYDAPEIQRFPQGTYCYEVDLPNFKPSYTGMCFSQHMNHEDNSRFQKMKCLGIYKCPVDGCQFVTPAQIPRKNRNRNREPDKASGQDTCSVHRETLVHVPCGATWEVFTDITVSSKSKTKINHNDQHNHLRPHEQKPSNKARAELRSLVKGGGG